MLDHDLESRFGTLFDQVVKHNDFEGTDEIKDFFNAIYSDHIEKWKADYNFNFEVNFEEDSQIQPSECSCYNEGK